jgi:hypothetical protein
MNAYIDESGDHNLDMATVDENYNIFVLALVFIRKEDYAEVDKKFRTIKKEIFGGEDFIIHTAELTRPIRGKSDPRNGVLRNPEVRSLFYEKINKFISESRECGVSGECAFLVSYFESGKAEGCPGISCGA